MDQPEAHNSTETAVPTQAIWETLSVAQQETVLQMMVWICCQIAEQWMTEVCHDPVAE